MVLMLNPRYVAYLKTTSKPKGYEFMIFINKMKRMYMAEYNVYGYSIDNHDRFTEFINSKIG